MERQEVDAVVMIETPQQWALEVGEAERQVK
jgi:hypothetical protein